MISCRDAMDIIRKTAEGRRPETILCPVTGIPGYVAAEDVAAPLSIQPFDNSAMDGFAVIRADLESANENSPAALQVAATVAAGDSADGITVARGSCARIMTGAPVPAGADAVVPVEMAEMQDGTALFKTCPRPFDHIRRAGEDFKKGDAVLVKGQMLGEAHILPLATLGIAEVSVYRKPRAAFLATGKELVDDLAKPLSGGEIYNSNGPYGKAVLERLGAEVVAAETVPDDAEAFADTLQKLAGENLDLIVSSGAVSAGAFDFVRRVLEKNGAEILYHKIAMKPGKPNLFARLPNGTLYFGLPGNPVATAVGLRFFVDAALRAMTGRAAEKPVPAVAETPFSKKPGLQMFLKADARIGEEGRLAVRFSAGQMSFMVHPFLTANCWAVAPEAASEIRAGETVEIYPFFPHSGIV